MSFEETKNNVCKLLNNARLLLESAECVGNAELAERRIGEAMGLARAVCEAEWPEPVQPPCTNAFVAEGCEQFGAA